MDGWLLPAPPSSRRPLPIFPAPAGEMDFLPIHHQGQVKPFEGQIRADHIQNPGGIEQADEFSRANHQRRFPPKHFVAHAADNLTHHADLTVVQPRLHAFGGGASHGMIHGGNFHAGQPGARQTSAVRPIRIPGRIAPPW